MLVTTDRFGDIDVDEDGVLEFGDGLPGFPDARSFTVVPVEGSDVFYWLQSVDDGSLAFLTVVPWAFFPDYDIELPQSDQEALGLTEVGDALVLNLVTVHRDAGELTANLLGPVVVNQATRRGRQVVLTDDEFPLQAPLAA